MTSSALMALCGNGSRLVDAEPGFKPVISAGCCGSPGRTPPWRSWNGPRQVGNPERSCAAMPRTRGGLPQTPVCSTIVRLQSLLSIGRCRAHQMTRLQLMDHGFPPCGARCSLSADSRQVQTLGSKCGAHSTQAISSTFPASRPYGTTDRSPIASWSKKPRSATRHLPLTSGTTWLKGRPSGVNLTCWRGMLLRIRLRQSPYGCLERASAG